MSVRPTSMRTHAPALAGMLSSGSQRVARTAPNAPRS